MDTDRQECDASREITRRIVLLVDDDTAVLKCVSRLLEHEGYSTCTAVNGQDAVEFLAEESDAVDAVLFDLDMPVMDGEDFAQRLRDQWPWIPGVLMTGNPGDPRASRTSASLGNELLTKPFNVEDLIRRLRALTK